MLLNYIKLAFRLLTRNPFFAGINVVGLAVGFTSFYVLWQYSTSELKSDQYHTDADISFNGVVGDFSNVKSKPLLITLGFIAFSILIMAWVNYVNLSVARVTRRFKDGAMESSENKSC